MQNAENANAENLSNIRSDFKVFVGPIAGLALSEDTKLCFLKPKTPTFFRPDLIWA